MKRSEARQKVFNVIFQREFYDDFDDLYERFIAEEGLKGVQGEYAKASIAGICDNILVLDQIIEENLKNWTFERIPKAVLAILRLGLYELIYSDDVPDKSAIDEAVKLAYSYCDEKDAIFINGLLHKVYKDKKAEKKDAVGTADRVD